MIFRVGRAGTRGQRASLTGVKNLIKHIKAQPNFKRIKMVHPTCEFSKQFGCRIQFETWTDSKQHTYVSDTFFVTMEKGGSK